MALSSSARFGREKGFSLVPGPAEYSSAISSIKVGHHKKPLAPPPSSHKFLVDKDEISRKLQPQGQRNLSAIEAAAQEASTKTTFGVAGRGDASHWNWVKSGTRPPRILSKLEQQRRRKLKKEATWKKRKNGGKDTRFGGVLEPTADEIEKTLPKRKFRKPSKDPSIFDRAPVDVDNFVASHSHLGTTYSGSFGDIKLRPSSSKGTFSSGSRLDRASRAVHSDMSLPAPNQYGDVNSTFGSKLQDRKRITKWIEDIKMLSGGSKKIDRAVAMLEDLPTGCSMLSQQRRYKSNFKLSSRKAARTKQSSTANNQKKQKKRRNRGRKKKRPKKDGLRRSKEAKHAQHGSIQESAESAESQYEDNCSDNENKSNLVNHLERMNKDAIASKAEMAVLRARLRSAGFLSDSESGFLKNLTGRKKNIKKSSLKNRLRQMRRLSASAAFGNAGLGGTQERFPLSSGTYYPGPGQYGDINSFKAAPRRPQSAASILSAMERVQREFVEESRRSDEENRSSSKKLKRARSASSSATELSILLKTEPPRTQMFSTFGASERGSLLEYQRRYGIGIGGQESPGPAKYGVHQRSDMSFGGRIRSANCILQDQEERQRRLLLVKGDIRKDNAEQISLLQKRAQSSKHLKPPRPGQTMSQTNLLTNQGKGNTFSFKLKSDRPKSAPLSPVKMRSIFSKSSQPVYLKTVRSKKVDGEKLSRQHASSVQEKTRRNNNNSTRRPSSASSGNSSPAHKSRLQARPASSKPHRSPQRFAQPDYPYKTSKERENDEEEYLDEDSDWENDDTDIVCDDVEDDSVESESQEDKRPVEKKGKTSKRELLANVRELAKRAQEISLAARAKVEKFSLANNA